MDVDGRQTPPCVGMRSGTERGVGAAQVDVPAGPRRPRRRRRSEPSSSQHESPCPPRSAAQDPDSRCPGDPPVKATVPIIPRGDPPFPYSGCCRCPPRGRASSRSRTSGGPSAVARVLQVVAVVQPHTGVVGPQRREVALSGADLQRVEPPGLPVAATPSRASTTAWRPLQYPGPHRRGTRGTIDDAVEPAVTPAPWTGTGPATSVPSITASVNGAPETDVGGCGAAAALDHQRAEQAPHDLLVRDLVGVAPVRARGRGDEPVDVLAAGRLRVLGDAGDAVLGVGHVDAVQGHAIGHGLADQPHLQQLPRGDADIGAGRGAVEGVAGAVGPRAGRRRARRRRRGRPAPCPGPRRTRGGRARRPTPAAARRPADRSRRRRAGPVRADRRRPRRSARPRRRADRRPARCSARRTAGRRGRRCAAGSDRRWWRARCSTLRSPR